MNRKYNSIEPKTLFGNQKRCSATKTRFTAQNPSDGSIGSIDGNVRPGILDRPTLPRSRTIVTIGRPGFLAVDFPFMRFCVEFKLVFVLAARPSQFARFPSIVCRARAGVGNCDGGDRRGFGGWRFDAFEFAGPNGRATGENRNRHRTGDLL